MPVCLVKAREYGFEIGVERDNLRGVVQRIETAHDRILRCQWVFKLAQAQRAPIARAPIDLGRLGRRYRPIGDDAAVTVLEA